MCHITECMQECRVGRAVRAYGHDLLPLAERTVNVYLHIATLPMEKPKSNKMSAKEEELQEAFNAACGASGGTLPKEKIKEVVQKVRKTNINALMQDVPDDGLTFEQLRDLLWLKGAKAKGDEELPWPKKTADEMMWKQLKKERTEMAAVLNEFKRNAADFDILRSALE